MTPTEQNQAIAEWMGWIFTPSHDVEVAPFGAIPGHWDHPDMTGQFDRIWEDEVEGSFHFNFHGSLDAMHEAEMRLSAGQSSYYAGELRKALGFHVHTYYDLLHATSQQRAEALLRTIGKWKD